MKKRTVQRLLQTSALISAGILALTVRATLHGHDHDDDHGGHHAATRLATGQYITPTAIDDSVQQLLNPGLPGYPDFIAGEAVRSQLSPDGSTLAVITAGQNSLYQPTGVLDTANSTQFIFLYDVQGAHRHAPQLQQVIQQVNAHVGLVFSPNGNTLYAAGGADDQVYVYAKGGTTWTAAAPIALNHGNKGIGAGVRPNAAGLAISADGHTLVVANNYNDSISVIDTATGTVRYEHDLRPWSANNENRAGGVGGTFPYGVVMKGNGTAYVSSDRDREVVVVDVSSLTAGRLITRIKVDGNALGMTLDHSQARLYVAQDNADQVAVINTVTNQVIEKIDARAPEHMLKGQHYTGAATSAVTLSPDGSTLYAVNSGSNAIAVIPLTGKKDHDVDALIPTAYEPHDITFSADGGWMYIVSGKSVTGPNPGHLSGNTGFIGCVPPGAPNVQCNPAAAAAARAANQYQFQLERASLVSAPVPHHGDLEELTNLVAKNNFYKGNDERDKHVMDFLSKRIKHVIYVVKENRTFDQILGDLNNGADTDPTLTQFGQAITPNHHQLATQFVTLDNFMNPGDGSMDGWSWSMQGRVTNTETLTQQINYAFVNRGLSYESEGMNRNVSVNWGSVAQRDAAAGPAGTTNYSTATAGLPGGTANVLTGTGNHASTDAPFGSQNGYIFDAVLRAGGTVRNYGFLVNNIGRISISGSPVKDPFGMGEIQVAPLDPALASLTDVYFRGYDQNYPDLWRYNEWKREFDQFVANGNLPSLTTFRISHDHMGSFGSALGMVNTPERQQADCDLALGRLVEAVANSKYAADTLIMVIEDDVQDGPDHVDSHRGTAYFVGPYVKQGAVVSTRYNQVSLLRTIEDILGTEHLNLNTAMQRPMADVFDIHGNGKWTFAAEVSTYLADTSLALASRGEALRYAKGPVATPQHDAAYWAAVTAGFDFSQADRVPPAQFNRVLWNGMMHGRPYPIVRGDVATGTSSH
jgi:YVTN family beta-propeller protein